MIGKISNQDDSVMQLYSLRSYLLSYNFASGLFYVYNLTQAYSNLEHDAFEAVNAVEYIPNYGESCGNLNNGTLDKANKLQLSKTNSETGQLLLVPIPQVSVYLVYNFSYSHDQ